MVRVNHPEVGICGLSCRLCPSFYTQGESRCGGCKSEMRVAVGCPFITCAVKRRGIEFCWDCDESSSCDRWRGHRDHGKAHDTFVSYQKLESNIEFIGRQGLAAFVAEQKRRGALLETMLAEFNDGRSKRFFCVAATVMDLDHLKAIVARATKEPPGMDLKARAKALRAALEAVARQEGYLLGLRK
jgi:hypothetical protein